MRTILVFLMIALGLRAGGQEVPRTYTSLYIGPVLGGTINNITFAGAESELGSRVFKGLEFGALAGIDLRWQFSDYVALRVVPSYVKRGYFNRYKTRELYPIYFTDEGDLHYFELPVVFRGGFGSDLVKVYGEAGFRYGYLFTGQRQFTYFSGEGGVDRTRIQGFRDRDDSPFTVNYHNLSVEYGLGIEFHAGHSILSFGASYLQGLTNLLELQSAPENYNTKHHTYTFQVGYVFQLPDSEYNLKK